MAYLESIIFHREWAEVAEIMPAEDKLEFLRAIDGYMLRGSIPLETSPIYYVFQLVRAEIESERVVSRHSK